MQKYQKTFDCGIAANTPLGHGYFRIECEAPEIAAEAQPGQFVHVRIDDSGERVLRRPFSICDAANGRITVVYKVVGGGTEHLARLKAGAVCNLMGPLGHGFSTAPAGFTQLAVCGGYGSAATFMLTSRSPGGTVLLGARTADDILLAEKYAAAGYRVMISTDDGSLGERGRVTALLEKLLAENPAEKYFISACGPQPMLTALAKLMRERGLAGELSLDHMMCCGIGACFSCAVKVKSGNAAGWEYARACADGPVFNVNRIYTE